MASPAILVRVPEKLLAQLQAEANKANESVPALIRRLLSHRISVKKSRAKQASRKLAYGFAGPARRKIKTYEDWFAGPAKRKIKTYEDWFSGPPGSANWKKRKV